MVIRDTNVIPCIKISMNVILTMEDVIITVLTPMAAIIVTVPLMDTN